jgi:hypothetical protein
MSNAPKSLYPSCDVPHSASRDVDLVVDTALDHACGFIIVRVHERRSRAARAQSR